MFNSHGAAADDGNVGRMMKIQPEWGEVHPNWLLYFQVESVDASVNLALELGGESLHEAMDFPYGRLITLKDPQNGIFGLMEMSQ